MSIIHSYWFWGLKMFLWLSITIIFNLLYYFYMFFARWESTENWILIRCLLWLLTVHIYTNISKNIVYVKKNISDISGKRKRKRSRVIWWSLFSSTDFHYVSRRLQDVSRFKESFNCRKILLPRVVRILPWKRYAVNITESSKTNKTLFHKLTKPSAK